MARKDRDQQSRKDQLAAYKKDIGKKYMDGLISDKEYEKLLREKEEELGLDAPATPKEAGNKECPSCGALVGDYDTACNICGGTLQPSLRDVLVETEEAPQTVQGFAAAADWRESWIDKPYRHLPPYELMKQPIDILKGVSAGDADRMRDAFGIRTLEDLAGIEYMGWARDLAAIKASRAPFRNEDYADKLDREYEGKRLEDILAAPTSALQGVSDGDAAKLAKSFNVKTVEQLGNLKFVAWALGIRDLAWKAAATEIPENWREEWLDKPYRTMPATELIKQAPDVLKGLSAGDADRLRSAFNVRTLEDFARVKYLSWACELAAMREDPGAFRSEDFKDKLDREYEGKRLEDILAAPTSALQGVSDADAAKLAKSFNVKTVEQLGNLKFIAWARGILEIAGRPHVFHVGDRVRLPTGDIGTVTYASKPDPKGMQSVEVGVG